MANIEAPPVRRARLLFVINSLAGGGAERVLATLLNNLGDRRSDFSIALAVLDRDDVAQSLPERIEIHQLDCRHGMVASIVQLCGLVRRLRPDLINSHLTRANVASVCAASVSGCRLVITEHVNTFAHLGGGLRSAIAKVLVRIAYPRADRVIAVSSGVRLGLINQFGIEPAKVETVFNPVDFEAIRKAGNAPNPFADRAPYLMTIGRLMPAKNHAMLIRAFARSGYSGNLIIAGEGPERAALEALASQLNVADRLLLPGFLANPYSVLKDAEAFALSSNVEGLSLALIEALALGKLVVTTNCPDGPSEILCGKATDEIATPLELDEGILTPVDDPECFASALQKVIAKARDGALPNRFNRPVFDPAGVREYYVKIFSELLSAKSSR